MRTSAKLATSVLCTLLIGAGITSPVGASNEEQAREALETVNALLGAETAIAATSHDEDTAVRLTEDAVTIDIASDPQDGIAIDSATSIVIAPTDTALGDFTARATTAVAAGDGYSSVAQPLEDGGFRMAVVLEDDSAPTSLSYEFQLESGVEPVRRADGGYDFVDSAGTKVGGIGAPWAIDAAGTPVEASYEFNGTVLTRTVTVGDSTAFPVVTNFCIFGKNPNGSCRGSGVYKEALAAMAAGWLTRAVCLTGALGAGAATAGLGAVAVASLCSVAGFAVGRWASGRV